MTFSILTTGLQRSIPILDIKKISFFQNALTYRLKDVEGLKLDVKTWKPKKYLKHQSDPVDDGEEFFREAIDSFKGELLPYVELETTFASDNFIRNWTEDEEEDGDEKIPAITLTVEREKSNELIAVFYSDAWGYSDWIFPQEKIIEKPFGKVEYTFLIPRVTEEDMSAKALHSKKAKQLIRVVLLGEKIPKKFELDIKEDKQKKMPKKYAFYQVRKNPVDGSWSFHTFSDSKVDIRRRWVASRRKPALLMIHGTHGTANVGFGQLLEDRTAMQKLSQKYGNRIFAFNHPSLFRGVNHNARTLKEMFTEELDILVGGESRLQLDIITRSRGSLVARQLIEDETLPEEIQIGKVLMLAGPNQGSHSASKGNIIRTFRINRKLKKLDKLLNIQEELSDLEEEIISLWMELMEREERRIKANHSIGNKWDFDNGQFSLIYLMFRKMDKDAQREWLRKFLVKASGLSVMEKINMSNSLETLNKKKRMQALETLLNHTEPNEVVDMMLGMYGFVTGVKPVKAKPEKIEDEEERDGTGFLGLLLRGASDQALGSELLHNLANKPTIHGLGTPTYFAISREFDPMNMDDELGFDLPGTSRLRKSLSRLLKKTFSHPELGHIKNDGINPVWGAVGKLPAPDFPAVPETQPVGSPDLHGKCKGVHHLNYLVHQEIRNEVVQVLTA